MKKILFCCIIVYFTPQVRTQHSHPTVVFILANDLGYGDVRSVSKDG
ncbi:MAG: hypothetical protein J7539_12710 [Niabella sp.]|nr:hypothetical protein [Niabella sp.]